VWQANGEMIAEQRDGFQGRVACAMDCPLIDLLQQYDADQPCDRCFIGKYADVVAAALISQLSLSVGLVECIFAGCGLGTP
jgi:hypothetical protein